MPDIIGTTGDDLLIGTDARDYINGQEGDDTIQDGGGDGFISLATLENVTATDIDTSSWVF